MAAILHRQAGSAVEMGSVSPKDPTPSPWQLKSNRRRDPPPAGGLKASSARRGRGLPSPPPPPRLLRANRDGYLQDGVRADPTDGVVHAHTAPFTTSVAVAAVRRRLATAAAHGRAEPDALALADGRTVLLLFRDGSFRRTEKEERFFRSDARRGALPNQKKNDGSSILTRRALPPSRLEARARRSGCSRRT